MLPRLQWCVVALVTLVPATARGVPTIPDVRTLADLRRLPAIPTDVGYDVRVGLADPGPDAGPYKLAYCLATARPGPASRPAGGSGRYRLGPLGVDVDCGERTFKVFSQERSQLGGPGPWLFCQSVPVDWVDDLTVRVSAGPTVIAERPLGKSGRRPLYWSRFAVDSAKAADGVIVDPNPRPACPAFDDVSSLLLSAADKPSPLPADTEPLPGADSLPLAWRRFYFATDDRPVTLSLDHDGGLFVITGTEPMRRALASERLLARWWVNGKPVDLAAHPRKQVPEQMRRVRSQQSSLPVRFGLPALLGPLEAGDKVGLQLMWVDHTVDVSTATQLRMTQMQALMRSRPPSPVPLPTDRLDVTLDAKLLSTAGR